MTDKGVEFLWGDNKNGLNSIVVMDAKLMNIGAIGLYTVFFQSVLVAQSCLTLCDPMD